MTISLRTRALSRVMPWAMLTLLLLWMLALPKELSARPLSPPVIDLHVDLSYRSLYGKKPFSLGSGQFAAEKLWASGVRGVVLPLFVPEDAPPAGRTRSEFERSYAHVFRSIVATPPYALPGCGIRRAGTETRGVSTWLAFEGSGPIGADEQELRRWVLRGVRSFGLVHSVDNPLAASSGRGGRRSTDRGLTDEGRRFVRAVYLVGGLIDVSHASDRATDEVLSIAKSLGKPVLATHSNARALAPHARNLTDAQIRGIAESGGVIGINFHQPFLRARPGEVARIDRVVEHILHVARLGGVGSVAIGSDFEGGIAAVPELSDAGRFPRLAAALSEAGLSDRDIRRVFFENAHGVLCR